MAANPGLITISTLRGGLDDNDSPLVMPDDSCSIAENVEFFYSTMGERRLGCSKLTDLPGTMTGDAFIQGVTWMGRHLPDNNLGNAELWALGQNLVSNYSVIFRRTASAWSVVTPNDAPTVTTGFGHRFSGVSLHGKFFIAHKSAVDFLHVWDGSTLRRTGMPAPNSPTAGDTGAGTFSGTRYYRVRFTSMTGAVVNRRSEPGPTLTFIPSGSGTGVIITKPATVSQGETHWELEASTDNANYYRIATTAVGTATVTDSVAFGTGYAITGILSEALTSYAQIPSGKYLSVDSDRLMIAGSWENSAYSSRLWWTPVLGNTGVGNDERLDMTVNPYIDLDGFEGGEITGLSNGVNGYLYAFKWHHIYKIVRTGQRTAAYSAVPLTKVRGALPGSLVEAVDQTGTPSEYFLDPKIGPMRIGQYGIEWCGRDLRALWRRVNINATLPAFGVFYALKNQVHWWIAIDGADHPNAKIVVQCNEMRSSMGDASEGARRGWSTVPLGNRIADAHCAIMFDQNVSSGSSRNQTLVPLIGKEQWTVNSVTQTDYIQRCDTGSTDCLVTGDPLAYYYATVQIKPLLPSGLLKRNGVLEASLMGTTVSLPANDIYVKMIKDFGVETLPLFSVDLSQVGIEDVFIKTLDQVSSMTMFAVQFAFGDLNPNIQPTTSWRLHAFAARVSGG